METKEPKKRIEVQLPKKLHEQLKMKFGNNLSNVMKKHYQEVLDESNYDYNKIQRCYFCDPKKIIPFSDLFYMWALGDDSSKEKLPKTMFVLCREHKEDIQSHTQKQINELANKKKEYRAYAFMRALFDDEKRIGRGESLKEYVKLCKHFPSCWKLHKSGVVISKALTKEELKQQFEEINTMEGL